MNRRLLTALAAFACLMGSPLALAQADAAPPVSPPEDKKPDDKKPDFPPFAEVSKGFEKVVSTADDREPLYTIWKREKDGQLLAELPRNFGGQKHFFATTVAGGFTWAGLQLTENDLLAYWKRYDKTMALIAPNLDTRSTGDAESQSGVTQQFTDRVILDVPIVAIGPSGQPVIDLDALLTGQIGKFFGTLGNGANTRLALVKECKAFPENIEVTIEMPVQGGELRAFHYSISLLPENTGYKPREADERIGYFTTVYRDLGQARKDKKWTRYIQRWQIEKRDPSLALSPPKKPIVYYVEHTVPVRYRRWVRAGIAEWNKAFEKVGIADAIEVYYQDKATGAHMDKDPEDVRYNFVRWISNDISTAIGPSRVDPRTGQILDADIVLTDGWIRVFWYQANQLLPETAVNGMSPETVAWLDKNPGWDPRLRLVDAPERDRVLAERAARGVLKYGGRVAGAGAPADNDPEGFLAKVDASRMCHAARGKGLDMALMRMHLELGDLLGDPTAEEGASKPTAATPGKDDEDDDEKSDDDEKKDKKAEAKDAKKDEKKQEMLDGIPEWYVGPMLMDLVAHEVGHTLGLRHNFKASSLYPLKDINSDAFKGKKNSVGSVMDYTPVNINRESGPMQGDWAPIGIGPYDYWVIEFGYTTGDPKKVMERVAEPELAYHTDFDVGGPDPLARRYDFSANPLDFAKNQMRLVEYYRSRIVDKFVKDGEAWGKARRGYLLTLNQQLQSISMMAPWVGGAEIRRDRKGDPNARLPIEVVPAKTQREALQFVIDTAFPDEAYGLTTDLLRYMTVDKWDDAGGRREIYEDATFPVHDRIIGVQATALTLLMNPTTLRRVHDNEFRIPAGEDAVTLPEVLNRISAAVWSELDTKAGQQFTPRQPMVSSLRRNLQREHLERLIDLTSPGTLAGTAASKPISNLATMKLRDLRAKIKDIAEGSSKANLDDYTLAHLSEAALRIDKVLDAQYIYNTDKIGGGNPFGFLFGQTGNDEGLPEGASMPALPNN